MRYRILIVSAGLLFVFSGCASQAPEPPQCVKAAFFDVGQGDAALITFPSGEKLLVDAGPEGCGIDTLLRNRGVAALDGVVLTHPHGDHYGGFRAVLGVATVGRLYLPVMTRGGADFEALLRYAIDTASIETTVLAAGYTLPGFGAAAVVCLWPPAEPVVCDEDSVNGRSLVLEVAYGRSRLFLAGDLPACGERVLMDRGWLKPVTVLKAGHHGSATSTSTALLALLSPAAVVISAGRDNAYGHPAPETLERIEQSDAALFETAVSGTVTVWMDEAEGLGSDRGAIQGR